MSCTLVVVIRKKEELRKDGISWQCVVSEEKGAKEAAVSGVWQLRVLKRRMGGGSACRAFRHIPLFLWPAES